MLLARQLWCSVLSLLRMIRCTWWRQCSCETALRRQHQLHRIKAWDADYADEAETARIRQTATATAELWNGNGKPYLSDKARSPSRSLTDGFSQRFCFVVGFIRAVSASSA